MQPFQVDDLLKTAQDRTGLSDFGPEDFMEGLEIFVASINAQGNIREDRWDVLRERILRLLMNRLWFAKDLAEHPEILDEDPGSPIIITSLPRSGSTKLHRMLGASDDFQVLRLWSAHMFARIPGLADCGKARRIQETREYERWLYETSPEILTGHPLFTDEAEEDQVLGEFTFRHTYLFGMFEVPEYAQWIMQADMQPTYDYFRMQIQYLQWQFPEDRHKPWVLKTPNHFGNEAQLTRIFDEPRFIVTHRDPAKCIPSITNTTMSMRKLHSDEDSSGNFIHGALQLFADSAVKHIAWRDKHPELEILDLSFDDVNSDGPGTIRKIYDFFAIPLSDRALECMRAWEQTNHRERFGKNVYSAEAVGTTESNIRGAFAPYMKRFSRYI